MNILGFLGKSKNMRAPKFHATPTDECPEISHMRPIQARKLKLKIDQCSRPHKKSKSLRKHSQVSANCLRSMVLCKVQKSARLTPDLSKWGIPRTGYFIPACYGLGVWPDRKIVDASPSSASSDSSWWGCRPPRPPFNSAYRPPWLTGLIEWHPGWLSSLLVWLSDRQDGCPVQWFDWMAARMAVQFTGLIEWQPGWLVLRMGCSQYYQDPRFLKAFSESESENISFQAASYRAPFQELTTTKIDSCSW